MHVTFRLPYLVAMLPLTALSVAHAESPMPDPIAPAVIGRPLDQIRPARPARPKPVAVKPNRPKQLAATHKAAPARPSPPIAARAAPPATTATQQAAKQANDHRGYPPAQAMGNVAQGTHAASRPFGPGAYFSSRDEALVRTYYARQPAPASSTKWRIGNPMPERAELTGVPDDIRAALPALPPGHQYVQLDGEVVLVAVRSRIVVDGVSRGTR